jgi:enoyl-CoA hydratase/carnithine racemase
MKDQNYAASKTNEIRLARRSPEYWRVTFDHPPLNIFGPEMLPQVNEIITALETDEQVKVVVFDSAVEGFFLIHLDFLAQLDDLAHLPPGPTGLHPWPEMLVRLSRAPVVSIASIRGRATGMGSELALACDMHFASREKAILSQFEVGAGLVPGGGPMAQLSRLMGRGRPGSDFERKRHPRRPGRALWLCESVVAGCRPRRIFRCARQQNRVLRQTDNRGYQAPGQRRWFAF